MLYIKYISSIFFFIVYVCLSISQYIKLPAQSFLHSISHSLMHYLMQLVFLLHSYGYKLDQPIHSLLPDEMQLWPAWLEKIWYKQHYAWNLDSSFYCWLRKYATYLIDYLLKNFLLFYTSKYLQTLLVKIGKHCRDFVTSMTSSCIYQALKILWC